METSRRTRDRARALRKEMSLPEVLLWVHLRKRQAGDLRFRRQHPIGPYVLDFYCDAARFAVEVDGDGHLQGDQPQRDHRRDAWLAERGIGVFRIAAREVLASPEAAVATVMVEAKAHVHLCALAATLEEWTTPEDEAAFGGL